MQNFFVITAALITITFLSGGIGLIICVLGYFAYRYFVLWSNLLFLQSFVYVGSMFESKENELLSNKRAHALTPWRAKRFIEPALKYANERHRGSKLAVIEEAESLGFEHDKWEQRRAYE